MGENFFQKSSGWFFSDRDLKVEKSHFYFIKVDQEDQKIFFYIFFRIYLKGDGKFMAQNSSLF
jgi:hypothetical protein